MSSEHPSSKKETAEYIDVSVAAIEKDGKFLVAKLAPHKPYAGKWEFPGGKLKHGETPKEAISREISEELGMSIEITGALPPVEYDYHRPDGRLFRLHGFFCTIGDGPLKMEEHEEFRWVTVEEMRELDLLESDKSLISFLEARKNQGG